VTRPQAAPDDPVPRSEPGGSRIRDLGPDASRFRDEAWAGLALPHKTLPCKYFYDASGSALFERICELPEYYPTRTELAILEAHADEMGACLGSRCLLLEFGSGSSRKTHLLLDRLREPAGYVPIDISHAALAASVRTLRAAYPTLEVLPLCADYGDSLDLPRPRIEPARRAVFFPGSTIGNFSPPDAQRFLARMGRIVGPRGGILIGVDLRKAAAVLEAAYDDRAGVTAAFNRNLLVRLNREVDADFELDRFRHRALWNQQAGRIEMHLVSTTEQEVRVAGRCFRFAAGESIHTENSYKYSLDGFAELAAAAGLVVRRVWTDERRWFSVQWLTHADLASR
jgi:dimethylhistidine N-methyltransferase